MARLLTFVVKIMKRTKCLMRLLKEIVEQLRNIDRLKYSEFQHFMQVILFSTIILFTVCI